MIFGASEEGRYRAGVSKAFTREDDAAPERPVLIERAATLPEGTRNYITPDGAAERRAELVRLTEIERPRLTNQDDPATKLQINMLDRRVDQLHAILQSAEIVPPPPKPHDVVRFGASVTVRETSGEQSHYRIAGADEVDLERDWVSWRTPIARALLNARLGEKVRFRFPSGEKELEIVAVSYPA